MTLLASLVRAYDRLPGAPPFGYTVEKISFVIGLNEDGTVASVSDLRGTQGSRRTPRLLQVPQPPRRTLAISANFLWDKTAYALGVTAGEGRRLGREHDAFVQRHLIALKETGDSGLRAFCLFLQNWKPGQFEPPRWPDEMKDQKVVFALESERRRDIFLHDRPAAREAWERLAGDGGPESVCLITGEKAPPARLHPPIKGVWGAQSSGASLVSFNLEAFTSYGHVQGDNAPVSEVAAFKYGAVLNAFLGGRDNRLQVGDTSTVFWADSSNADLAHRAESMFAGMWNDQADADPAADAATTDAVAARKVGTLLHRIRSGVPLAEADPEVASGVRFHVLGLAPNAARLAIRFWFEDTFGALAENYHRFATDIRIEPPGRDLHPALWKYLAATAVLGKRENVPPNLAGEWMRSILSGTPYPLTLLSTVLMRIRADRDVSALRVGMLRALLVRNFRKGKEAPMALDPDNRNKGYLLGRLFATYEQAQSAALGRNVNATIKDKYYGAASAQPRRVFSLLEKGSANHLSKVGKQRPGQRTNLTRTIGSILEAMSPGDDPFPTSLNAQEQALFGLGYYHQRNAFFSKAADADRPHDLEETDR